MKLERSKFSNNSQSITLAEDCAVNLQVWENEVALPRDVTVTAFGMTRTFRRLAPVRNKSAVPSRPDFQPILDFVTSEGSDPALLIVGLRDIVVVDCNDQTIDTAVSLNRQEHEEQGFYWMKFLPSEYGLVLVYESGAMRFDKRAKLIWHTKLSWDDVFLNADERYLYYSSEFGEFAPADWTISLSTGDKAALPTY